MSHPNPSPTRPGPRTNRRPSRRARVEFGRGLGLGLEWLEDRAVPTIVFPATSYGSETVTDGGSAKLPNVTLVLVFWGTSAWTSSPGVFNADANGEIGDARALASSPYFGGLQQYVGGTPHVSVNPTSYICSLPAPAIGSGAIAESTLTSNVFGIVGSAITASSLPSPTSFGGSTPIYVVVTPPGVYDSFPAANGQPAGTASGFNKDDPAVVYPGTLGFGDAHVIWAQGVATNDPRLAVGDPFSVTLGHETLETMTDPFGGPGISIGPSQPGGQAQQLGDGNARSFNYRVNGVMVQSYWSRADTGYIIPDGYSAKFLVTTNPSTSQGQFTEGSYQTLNVTGGQNGATSDTITVNRLADGEVTAILDGQLVHFDANAVSNVVVNAVASATTVNLTGVWGYGTGVTINAATTSPVTINVSSDAGNEDNFLKSSLLINDPHRVTRLNLDDQHDPSAQNWMLDGTTFSLGGVPIVEYPSGRPGQVTLSTGPASGPVDVEAAPSPIILTLGGPGSNVSFASQGQSLRAIQQPVSIVGIVSTLNFLDYTDADTTAATVSLDAGFFSQSNASYVSFSGSPAINYYAGSENVAITAAGSSKNLDALVPSIRIFGGPGKDSLTVNDSAHLGLGEYNSGYILNSASVGRYFATNVVGVGLVNQSRLITFTSLTGGVTLDSDNVGTPVDVENSGVGPVTVNVGTGSTPVTLAPQYQSLAGFLGPVTLNGGPGADSLIVNDQKDPWTAGYLVFSGTYSSIYRTYTGPPYSTTVSFKGFGAVTLNTDNNGSAVDVEGINSPTTVDLGSGNTAVTVAGLGQSLSPFARVPSSPMPLTINGGPGSDSLAVDDQQDPWTPGGAYTVTASAVTRVNLGGSDPNFLTATINYSGISAGVTLNADNNGSSVDVEGTSAPTAVNLGSGNTAVSVESSGKDLGLLANDLTVTGGSGTDSLAVNDSLNPLAYTRSGTTTTSYSYAVTGQAISRTRLYHGLFVSRLARSINYANILGGVTVDTDNNGTPLDVEGTSAPTTVVVGSGATAISVTTSGQDLNLLGADLTVVGGAGADSLLVDDALNPNVTTTGRYSSYIYNYTVTNQAISRTTNFYGLIHGWSTRTVNYANIRGGVTFDTDNNGTPVGISGASGAGPVTIDGGAGVNGLTGPGAANSWSLTAANAGSLDGWVTFAGFANLSGGGLSDSFDFGPSGSISGNLNGQGGNDLLNYVRVSTPVAVNLATGKASGVGGSISGIQGVVGGSGNNALTGSGRSLLIGGAGASQLVGGAGDSLMIAGSTLYGLQDAALEAILTEWDRTDLGFAARAAHLTSGGGLNGSNVLTLSTVSNNGKADTITSNSVPGLSQSWIFASATDVILTRKPLDQVLILPGT